MDPSAVPTPPLRFADFFFQCGLHQASSLSERLIDPDASLQPSQGQSEAPSSIGDDNGGGLSQQDVGDRSGEAPATPGMPLPKAKLSSKQHPLEWTYSPQILSRYPEKDYGDKEKFPAFLPMFCFPKDIKLRYEDTGPPPETFHSFIITEETGAKMYGVCVIIYEKLCLKHAAELESLVDDICAATLGSSDLEYIQHIQSQLAENQEALLHARMGMTLSTTANVTEKTSPIGAAQPPPLRPLRQQPSHSSFQVPSPLTPGTSFKTFHTLADAEEKVALYRALLAPLSSLITSVDNVYAPRAFGVLSHWPWYDFLKEWLCEVIKVGRSDEGLPIERYVVNLIHEVPLPPPGKLELSVHVGQVNLFISRPPVNALPMIKNFSLYPLLRSLSPQNILLLLELALAEHKIIFISSHLSMLTPAVESLLLHMYPFTWQHILIPLLPKALLSYLQAPMPYIIGVGKEYWDPDSVETDDATVIDLDVDSITMNGDYPVSLPPRERKKILSRLERLVHFPYSNGKKTDRGVPLTMQQAMPLGKSVGRCWKSCISPKSQANVVAERRMNSLVSPMRRPTSTGWLDKIGKQLSFANGIVRTASMSTSDGEWEDSGRRDVPGPTGSDGPEHLSPVSTRSSLAGVTKSTGSSTEGVGPRLMRSFGGGSRAGSRVGDDRPLVTSPSSASLAGIFIGRKGSRARPSLSGQSTISASTTSTVAPYPRSGSEETSGMRMSKDGHSFRALAVKSAWTGRDLDDVLSSSGDLFLSEAENDAHQHFAPSNDLSKDRAPSVISSISKLPRFNLKKAAGRSKSVDVMNAGSVGVVRKLSNASSRTTVGQTTVPVPVVTLELGVQCDFCREDLVEDGDTMVLCCEECAIMIHPSCVDTADIAPCSARYSDARVQTAFLKLFVSLFRNYRQYLLPLADGHEDPNGDVQDNWFRFEDFMDSLDKESKPWYQMFFGTQAWAQFALERVERPESDIETLFFDEHITAKRNRSKLRISKEVTPFLTDDSYSIRSTLSCLPPNADHLPARVSGGLPTELDSSLLYVPREVKALVTPHELRLSKSAMGDSLIARARTRKDEKRKQEFGKWMKGKWREFSKAGGGEVVGLGFLPDDRRRALFAERIEAITAALNHYATVPLSSMSTFQRNSALEDLHAQNLVLMRATDEEQLVGEEEMEMLRGVVGRIVGEITRFEDYERHVIAEGCSAEPDPAATTGHESDSTSEEAGPVAKSRQNWNAGLRLSFGASIEFGSVSDWLNTVGTDAPPSHPSSHTSQSSVHSVERNDITRREYYSDETSSPLSPLMGLGGFPLPFEEERSTPVRISTAESESHGPSGHGRDASLSETSLSDASTITQARAPKALPPVPLSIPNIMQSELERRNNPMGPSRGAGGDL